MPTTGGCLALSGRRAARGCVSGAAAARGRRRDPRQGEPARARARPDDGQLARRADARTRTTSDAAPGGSSGGSGVAAAANFAAFTHRHRHQRIDPHSRPRTTPSSACGRRRACRAARGIIPFGHTQDTGGPMARTRGRRRDGARRHGRIRPGRSRDGGQRRQDARPTYASSLAGGRAARRAPRRARRVLRRGARGSSRWPQSCGAPWPT